MRTRHSVTPCFEYEWRLPLLSAVVLCLDGVGGGVGDMCGYLPSSDKYSAP